ncbi:28s ribosomal protein s18a mitochondrial [Paragonimus heterotremus]|uniref:28s ribosomal protein s18a mitochondrial n=1 Tax=Paragonimus heterotremus TaxID=100268 RepID=A0A8J4SYC3_9TREM|nr:28s ribosomal protein s18a mitochondrial [Paragonimus heterotremus]
MIRYTVYALQLSPCCIPFFMSSFDLSFRMSVISLLAARILKRSHSQILRNHRFTRRFTCSANRMKKEIRCSVENNRTIIEGVHVPSERADKVVRLDGFGDPRDTDPISRLNLNLAHTDVRILSQFLRPDGTVLPRSVSGISLRSQLYIELLIERAKKAGMSFIKPFVVTSFILLDFFLSNLSDV